jgi:Ca2+-binding RTX toxin-like protein
MAIKRLTALADIFRDTNTGNTILGLAGNDTIYGNGGNDILDGGKGKDTLRGGKGNDTYVVDNVGDKVIESANQGSDLVKSKVTFTLGANVEKLTLTGLGNINGTGNALANTIAGNAGNNVLDGGAGNDTLNGGAGNDTYVLGATNDVVNDLSGIDTISSTVTRSLASYAGIENLTLLGVANIDGTGNADGNVLVGNAGSNTLTGMDGADKLIGGAGLDLLFGGAGADKFVFTSAADSPYNNNDILSWDIIEDFQRAEGDKIDLSAIFHGTAPSLGVNNINIGNGTVNLKVDTNNDGTFDLGFRIVPIGLISFDIADFIF